jgi:hypothetical protein
MKRFYQFIKEDVDIDLSLPDPDADEDIEYLNRLLNKSWEEEEDPFVEGGKITYRKEGSEHDGKNGIFTGIREDGKYRITLDDGKKLAVDGKNVVRFSAPARVDPAGFTLATSLKPGDRVIYINQESKHNEEDGTFMGVRGDGKYHIQFDDGSRLAASPGNVYIPQNLKVKK